MYRFRKHLVLWNRIFILQIHLAEVTLLEEFQHLEIVALDVEVFRRVPVAALLDATDGACSGSGVPPLGWHRACPAK